LNESEKFLRGSGRKMAKKTTAPKMPMHKMPGGHMMDGKEMHKAMPPKKPMPMKKGK
jgi:hypothetical protein